MINIEITQIDHGSQITTNCSFLLYRLSQIIKTFLYYGLMAINRISICKRTKQLGFNNVTHFFGGLKLKLASLPKLIFVCNKAFRWKIFKHLKVYFLYCMIYNAYLELLRSIKMLGKKKSNSYSLKCQDSTIYPKRILIGKLTNTSNLRSTSKTKKKIKDHYTSAA